MKKFLSLLLAMILLISCMTVVAFAAEDEETVTISFSIDENPGFSSYGAKIEYDSSALELTEIKKGAVSADGSFSSNVNNGKVGFAHDEDTTATGVLFTATFKIRDTAKRGETYNVTASLDENATKKANQEKVALKISGGSITVDECRGGGKHDWQKTGGQDATCTEDGYADYKCSKCQDTKHETLKAKGSHSPVPIPGKDPNCTESGLTEGKKCSVCQEILVKQETIPAKGHTETPVPGKDPTCTETGLTEGKKCSVCQEILVKQQTIPAKGHDYGDDGLCKNCGQKKPGETTPVTPRPSTTSKPTGTTTTKKLPFDDVKKSDWYYDDVRFVYDEGLMNGISSKNFAPLSEVTRGMIVTILWRMEGEPAPARGCQFSDVASGSYYEKAIAWAAENGIVTGISATEFRPDDNITREQLAAILYRYAKYKGMDVSAGETGSIQSFSDASSVSEYAVTAMKWACGTGLINGISGKLVPAGTATRAQTAAILHRFCE